MPSTPSNKRVPESFEIKKALGVLVKGNVVSGAPILFQD